jgi:hypothetical protein
MDEATKRPGASGRPAGRLQPWARRPFVFLCLSAAKADGTIALLDFGFVAEMTQQATDLSQRGQSRKLAMGDCTPPF